MTKEQMGIYVKAGVVERFVAHKTTVYQGWMLHVVLPLHFDDVDYLETARGKPRVFKTLDSLSRAVSGFGADEVQVRGLQGA